MTTDIDVSNHNHGEVRESEEVEVVVVANNGGEQCSGFDVVGPTQDLLPKSNGSKDDVDGSYVFVTGHDDGDDLVESDLANDNNKPVEEFQVEEKNNVGRDTEVSGSADEFNSPPSQVVDDGQVQEGGEDIQESDIAVKNSDEQGLAEDVEKDLESDIGVEKDTNNNDDDDNVVNDNTDQEVEMPEESLNEIPLEGSRDDPNQEDPSTVSSCLESEIKPDTVIEEMTISGDIGDGLPDVHEKDDEASQCLDVHENQNGSSENVESVPSSGEIGDSLPDGHGQDDATRSVEEDVHEHQVAQNTEIGQQSSPTALDCEKPSSFSEEDPAEGSKEHSLETTSTSEGDKTLETGVANGPLFEQIGESSPAGFAHESLLETAVGTEQDGPPTALDNEKLSSFSEGVPVEEFKGDDGESLGEHSLKTPSSTGVDKTLETAVSKGTLLEQNGEDLPPGLAQESLSETAVVTEQIGSSENSESLTSSSICSYVALESGQSLPTKDVTSEIDTGESNQESIENPDDSCHVETQNCPVMNDAESKCAANGVISNPESCGASNGGEEKASADAIDVESAISNTSLECGDNQHMSNTSIELESEVDNALNDNDNVSGIAADGDLDFEHVGKELKSTCQEAESFEGKQTDETPKSVQENLGGQNVDIDGNQKDEEASTTIPDTTSEGQNAAVEGGKRLFYLIKIPRFDDGNLREQIEHTKLQVEERTKSREAIYAEVQKQRVIHKECSDKVQACLTEEKAARDSFKSIRQRLDSVQSVIGKVKNAQSVGDIQEKIRSMKNRIEHETLPLKEEKHLIREIEQLQQQLKHISSNVGKQGEVLQALDQKDQIEEHSKVLRKELDSQREKLTKAEEVTQTAKKKSKVENEKLNELVYQFRDANDVRQEAYAHLQCLKKQQYERNKHFWRYKDALSAAQKLALSGDKEQLQRLCNDQLETVMELWNRNDDFRREYMIYNTRSTLRRLRTWDGRSLGPDEEPPVIPDAIVINNRATKDNSVSLTKMPEQEKQDVPAKAEKLDVDKSGAKVVERENQTAKTKKPAKLASLSGTRRVTISGEDERKEEAREEEKEEEEEEQPRRSKEEEELARKAEELRKEEEAAKLKEQRKLEERAKAKEAMERKKRIAEKAQARAAIRAQKEAEEKEKEREKRARKKGKNKAHGIETRNEDGIECAPTPSSEIPSNGAQPESEKPATVMKRPQKAQQFTKQSRTRSVAMPPPVRNRGKTRMQQWMWVTLAVAIVLALFFCWPSFMQWFGF